MDLGQRPALFDLFGQGLFEPAHSGVGRAGEYGFDDQTLAIG